MIRYRRAEGISETEIDGELFLVELASQQIFHLDRAASALWRLLEGPMDETEIAQVFAAAFPEMEDARIAADVSAALARLSDGGLVVPDAPA